MCAYYVLIYVLTHLNLRTNLWGAFHSYALLTDDKTEAEVNWITSQGQKYDGKGSIWLQSPCSINHAKCKNCIRFLQKQRLFCAVLPWVTEAHDWQCPKRSQWSLANRTLPPCRQRSPRSLTLEAARSRAFRSGLKLPLPSLLSLLPPFSLPSPPTHQPGLCVSNHTTGLGFSQWPAEHLFSQGSSPRPSPGSQLHSQASLPARNHPWLQPSELSPQSTPCSSVLRLLPLYGDCQHAHLFPQARQWASWGQEWSFLPLLLG